MPFRRKNNKSKKGNSSVRPTKLVRQTADPNAWRMVWGSDYNNNHRC